MTVTGRRVLTGISAVAGVVLAHTIDYALVHPHPSARASELLASGHGYWPAATVVASIAGLAVVWVVIFGAARRGALGRPRRERGSAPRRLAHCAVLQIVLFVVMEMTEHAVVGVAPTELGRSPEFLLGLPLQLLVAAVLAGSLAVLQTLTERVARRLRTTGARPMRPWHPLRRGGRVRAGAPVLTPRPRGPPSLVSL